MKKIKEFLSYYDAGYGRSLARNVDRDLVIVPRVTDVSGCPFPVMCVVSILALRGS